MVETNKSIEHKGQPNKIGLSWVKAIPAHAAKLRDWFSLLTGEDMETNYSYLNLDIATGFNWLDIGNDFPTPFTFTESEKDDNPQGHLFSYTIQQQVPQNDLVSRGQLLRFYSRNEWLLVFKATNGAVRVIGLGNGHGAKFKRSYTSGSQLKGVSVYTLDFTWDSPEQALYLKDPLEDLLLNFSALTVAPDGTFLFTDITSTIILSNTTLTPDITIQYWDGSSWIDVQTFTPIVGMNTVTEVIATPTLGTYWFRATCLGSKKIYSNQLQGTVT